MVQVVGRGVPNIDTAHNKSRDHVIVGHHGNSVYQLLLRY
jgi:hypothetical protein